MSMISAQCDELRAMAESVGLAVPQAATLMMEAADTILELRDDLQRANDAVQDAEHDESRAWDRVRKAEAENTKLVRVLHEVEREAVHAYKCLQKDCETMTASASHYFEKWWHVECQNDRLKAKNAKLREELADAPSCDSCEAMLDCDECLRADSSQKERRRISAENAKLREIIADLEELLPESERWYSHETVKATAEDNAKLRELVKEVFYKLLNVAGGRRELTAGEAQRTMDRMHELGVEVDG